MQERARLAADKALHQTPDPAVPLAVAKGPFASSAAAPGRELS